MADRELSEGEIRQFREDGYVILRDFVEPAVIAAWRCAVPASGVPPTFTPPPLPHPSTPPPHPIAQGAVLGVA